MINNPTPPTPLDKFFQKDVEYGGQTMPSRPAIQFLGPGVSVADNEPNGTTDVTITAGGSGGQQTTSVANGLNSNIATNGQPTLRLTGPTGAFSVGGFVAATAGATLVVTNTTTEPMTIVHQDGSSSAANRIDTQSNGANVVLQPGKLSAATFVYDGSTSGIYPCWKLVGIGAVRPNVFNVQDYGAKGDGATNDYNAIVAAIAASVAAGGGTVFFPPTGASYVCEGIVSVPGNIKIAGPHATDDTTTAGAVISFQTVTGSGFQLEANVFDTIFEDLLLTTDSVAGPPIGCVNGANLSAIHFNRLKIILGNPAVGGIALGSYAEPCAAEPVVFDSVKITAAAGFHEPLIGGWSVGGGLSNWTFQGKCLLTGTLYANIGTPLSGTATLSNGSTAVLFSQPQTLKEGQLLRFSYDPTIVYEVATATSSSIGATLVTAYSGVVTGTTSTTSMVAPMIDIESTDTGAIDNIDISGIIFELPYTGAVKFRAVRNAKIDNCWLGDMAPNNPINHLVWIGAGRAGGSPPAANITIEHMQCDVGVRDAASVFTGANGSTQGVSIKRSTIPFIQNVPTRDAGGYAANQGYFPIEFEGSLLGGFAGDAPTGTYSNVYRRDWGRALPPDTVTCRNGLNSGITAPSGEPRSRFRIVGPTAAFSIDSITGTEIASQSLDGFELELYNSTTQYMTLIDKSTATGGTSATQLRLGAGGANLEVPGPGFARFTYDTTNAEWQLASVSPGAAPFNPSRVASATLVAWWDANLRYTVATGVSSWVDAIQGRALVQATTAKQPAWSATSGPNSLPGITFTAASNQSLQGTGFNFSQAMTIFIVCKWNSSTTAGTVLDGAATGNQSRFFRTSTSTEIAIYAGAQVVDSSDTPQSFHVFMLYFNGSSSTITTDGVVKGGPSNAGTTAANGLTVGNYGDAASDPADAIVSEILVFEGTLSATDESRVGKYLAAKYNISGSW